MQFTQLNQKSSSVAGNQRSSLLKCPAFKHHHLTGLRIFHNKSKGFTFIEIAIVIAIIGIIASLTLTGLNSVRANSRDTKRVSDISQIQTALEMYKRENYVYPAVLTPGMPLVVGTQTYLDTIPVSPGAITGDTYTYVQDNSGLSYHINYVLEKALASTVGGSTAGSSGLNYQAVPGQASVYVFCTPSCGSNCSGDSDGCGGTCTGVCSWKTLGTAGFSAGGSPLYSSIAFNPSTNQPYVAYVDNANSQKMTVKYYNGSAWTALGTVVSSGQSTYSDIVFNPSTNQPYVVYTDGAQSGKATVRYYNGVSWTTVGSAGFSAGAVYNIVMAFNPSTNLPYVAYADNANSQKLTVMKYDGVSAWENVGSAGFSATAAGYPSIAFNPSTNQPCVVYFSSSNKTTTKCYDGANWNTLGDADFSVVAVGAPDMAFDPSTNLPYVVFSDYTLTKARVMYYNGVSWVNFGTAGFSASYVNSPKIAFNPSTNQPYVAYGDVGSSGKVTAKYHNGSDWTAFGSAAFSAGFADYIGLAFNPSTNRPYVVYQDNGNSDKATVMYWGP